MAAPAASPMPDSGFRVAWISSDVPSTLQAGESITVGVTLKNTSDQKWADFASWIALGGGKSSGPSAVRLSHRWWDSEMKAPLGPWAGRVELPHPVVAGESVTMAVKVTAPDRPGAYHLQFDLVQELVAWFESKGAPRCLIPVVVK